MRDLTQGPIVRHQLSIAVPMAVGMIFQTLYYFVDLYFVAQLGDSAIAGVSAAGNAYFVTFALSQLLGVGTAALISHAVGRKDPADANLVFKCRQCGCRNKRSFGWNTSGTGRSWRPACKRSPAWRCCASSMAGALSEGWREISASWQFSCAGKKAVID